MKGCIFFSARLCFFLVSIVFFRVDCIVAQEFDFRQFNDDESNISNQYIYAISEDSLGNIIFSAGDGLFLFDGKNFQGLSDDQELNSIYTHCITKDGTIWAGRFDGKLVTGSVDSFRLSDSLFYRDTRISCLKPDSENHIWLGTLGDGLAVIKGNEVLKIKSLVDKVVFDITFDKNGDILVSTTEGLRLISKEFPHELKSTPYTGNDPVIWFSDLDSTGGYWTGSKNGSIHYNTNDHHRNQLISLQDFGKTETVSSYAYNASNHSFWLGTKTNGLYVFQLNSDRNLHYWEHITVDNGLVNNFIQSLYFDQCGNLWIGTYGHGVQQLYPGRIRRYFNEEDKIYRCIFELKDGQLLVGTTKGLQYIEKSDSGRYIINPRVELDGNSISTIYEDEDKTIWLGTEDGAVYKKDRKSEQWKREDEKFLEQLNFINKIDNAGDNKIGIATDFGFFIHHIKDGSWKEYTTKQGLPHNAIKQFKYTSSQKLMLLPKGSNPVYIDLGKLEIGKHEALNEVNPNLIEQGQNNSILLGSFGKGILVFDDTVTHRYNRSSSLLSDFIYGMGIDSSGTTWVLHREGISVKPKDQGFLNFGSINLLDKVVFSANNMVLDQAGLLWVITERGLVQLTTKDYEKLPTAPQSIFNSIELNYRPLDSKKDTVLAFDDYILSINFKGIQLAYQALVECRYKMEGLENDWNIHESYKGNVKYNRLQAGSYRFILQTKISGAKEWNTNSYQFEILSPYWETWWFRLACVLITGTIVFVTFYIREKNHKRIKSYLSHNLKKRTREVREQKKELEVKNLEITQSIVYAQRIQNAVIPDRESIESFWKDTMVFYKPRDIVSGDFYWVSSQNSEKVLVLSDCTGHGIPGAFMSMIGTTILGDIINKGKVTLPSKILTYLNSQLVQALGQQKEDSIRDGMDASVVSLNSNNTVLTYSGALRPLYLVRNGELVQVNGDRNAVGGFSYNGSEKKFTDTSIQIEKGDTIYLFSDGYPDQFGGPKMKKFKIGPIKLLFKEIATLNHQEQYKKMDEVLSEWMGDENEQTDDISVIAINF
ncbi:MAG: SpoIIE family protein phosphatase [Flavobacteriales bacterium]|nr:SpoIIE family protein phosphatase [Flavobacteriales bacterium]